MADIAKMIAWATKEEYPFMSLITSTHLLNSKAVISNQYDYFFQDLYECLKVCCFYHHKQRGQFQ